MARRQVGDVVQTHQITRMLRNSSGDGLQQVADVVAEVDPLQRLANEPGCRVVENRHALRSGVPRAEIEFVDLIPGFATEQPGQVDVATMYYVYGQIVGSCRHPTGVIGAG